MPAFRLAPLLVVLVPGACSNASSSSVASEGGATNSAAPCDTPAGTTTALFTTGLYVYSLAVDDTYVYAGTPQGVWSVPRSGGTPEQIIGGGEVDAVASDGSHLYFAGTYSVGSGPRSQSATGLFSAPLGGGAATLLSADAWSTQIVVDDANVYGASGGPWSVPIGGGGKTSLVQGSTPYSPTAIALYGANVYGAAPSPQGAVVSVPKAGGALTVLVPNRAHPAAIAVDASGIYWGEYSYLSQAGGIFRAALDGSGVTMLSPDDDVSGLAIDEAAVYWSEQHTNTIRSVPKGGGATVTLASGLNGPAGIAEYAGNVYWAEQPFVDAAVAVGDASEGAPTGDAGEAPTLLTTCK